MKKAILLAVFLLTSCSSSTKFHGGDISASGPNLDHVGGIWEQVPSKVENVVK